MPARRCAGHFSFIFTILGESDYQKHIVKLSLASWNTVKIVENGKKKTIFSFQSIARSPAWSPTSWDALKILCLGSFAGVILSLKTPTAGHRRTPIQSASAITAEAEAGTNAGTLERQNLRICKTCISANPAYLHNLRICKT